MSTALRVALADALTADTNLRADGTLWSHAATLGSFVYGSDEFSIDATTLEQVVANFTAGYPQKVPVDYEHETALKDLNRAAVPFTLRAGQIVEARAVLADADLLPEMRAQVDAERARRAKIGLARDVDPLGLWIRWEPTQRALTMVKAREVTEMSVVIAFDHPDKHTGEGQGPTLLSVALTNTPFLDDMIPVAASRRPGAARSASADQEQRTMDTKPNRLLLALTALFGKPVATEEDAAHEVEQQIATFKRQAEEGQTAKTGLAMLTTELGEPDPGKALGVIRALKAHAKASEEAAATGQGAAIDAFLAKHEAKLGSVAAREHFKATLTADAKAAPTTKLEELPTGKVILSLKAVLGRSAGVDANDANVTDSRDVILDRRAREMVAKDEELKALSAKSGFNSAYLVALKKAQKELPESDAGTEVVTG